jgi:hypothetical protein
MIKFRSYDWIVIETYKLQHYKEKFGIKSITVVLCCMIRKSVNNIICV